MSMLKKLGRLFVIKTRWEAYAVTYAIAVGAIERGMHYRAMIPGNMGWVFFALCLGVVFIAGAKLIDSVKPVATATSPVPAPESWRRSRRVSRSRPSRSGRSVSASARLHRRD